MADEVDPAAEFLAREQNVLAEIDDGFEIPAKGMNFNNYNLWLSTIPLYVSHRLISL